MNSSLNFMFDKISIVQKEAQDVFTKTSSPFIVSFKVDASKFMIFLFDFLDFLPFFRISLHTFWPSEAHKEQQLAYMLTSWASHNSNFQTQSCSPSSHAQISCGSTKFESFFRLCGNSYLPVPCSPQSQQGKIQSFYQARTELPISSWVQ